MNFQKVPSRLAEFCTLLNERRQQLMASSDVIRISLEF